jgi:GH15 family glucan-1,4-alpha-glucosidase
VASRIEDYALIGDCETAALVSRDGSVDWLCWPRFDSGAVFAALLGGPEHGRWSITTRGAPPRTVRRYRPGTLVLETELETDEGAVTLIDFMPPRTSDSDLVRLVVGRRGNVGIHMELTLRFDYGSSVPWVTRLEDGPGIRAVAGPDLVTLRTRAPLENAGMTTTSDFVVRAGETVAFVLAHEESHLPHPKDIDPLAALAETEAFWHEWTHHCREAGAWTEQVKRSLITLKALTYRPTGGIVAAATTSLPEAIGGTRNWDYRYVWLRDATFTLLALMNGGYYDEASAFGQWLAHAAAGSPSQLQIMYGVAGERRLPEWELDWLPGYEASRPVRVGNRAAVQLQLDVYGELMDALHQARRGGAKTGAASWDLERAFAVHLENIWHQPDEGIWEVRSGKRQFTYSKVMAWVALDRAVKSAEQFGLPGPVARWREVAAKIHADVCRNGFDRALGSFVQSYGGKALDASLLLLPIVGFLPPEDPRVSGTVRAIERGLVEDGLVLRYDTHQTDDGLPPGEGAFLACSFWLADNYVLTGRWEEGRALFERLLALSNDVGLLAEQYDTKLRRFTGNFPQGFSHVALVNTAFNLSRARGPALQRAELDQPHADVGKNERP